MHFFKTIHQQNFKISKKLLFVVLRKKIRLQVIGENNF